MGCATRNINYLLATVGFVLAGHAGCALGNGNCDPSDYRPHCEGKTLTSCGNAASSESPYYEIMRRDCSSTGEVCVETSDHAECVVTPQEPCSAAFVACSADQRSVLHCGALGLVQVLYPCAASQRCVGESGKIAFGCSAL